MESNRESPNDAPTTPLAWHYVNNPLGEHIPADMIMPMFTIRRYPEDVVNRLRELLSLPAEGEIDAEAVNRASGAVHDQIWEVLLAHTMKLMDEEHARREAILAEYRERLEEALSPEQIVWAAMVFDTSLLEEKRDEAQERFGRSLGSDAETKFKRMLGEPDAPKFEMLLWESMHNSRRSEEGDGNVEEE